MIESYAHSYSFIHSFIGLADFRVGFDYIIIKIELVCSTILKNLILGRRVIMFDEMEIMRHGERTNIVFKKGRENNWIKKKVWGNISESEALPKIFVLKNYDGLGNCVYVILVHGYTDIVFFLFGHEK